MLWRDLGETDSKRIAIPRGDIHVKFGTDGVRGVANTELTADFALRFGRAAAQVLGPDAAAPVVVLGGDTRESHRFGAIVGRRRIEHRANVDELESGRAGRGEHGIRAEESRPGELGRPAGPCNRRTGQAVHRH